MFFQDLSATVLRKWKGFEDVKKRLRDIGAKYMMLYPATLKIVHGGVARSFDSPAKARAFVDTLSWAAPESPTGLFNCSYLSGFKRCFELSLFLGGSYISEVKDDGSQLNNFMWQPLPHRPLFMVSTSDV